MDLTQVKFPYQLTDSLHIVCRLFMGIEQYYLMRGKTQLRLLDPEEVEELISL